MALLALVCALGLVLAACGSGDDDGGSSGDSGSTSTTSGAISAETQAAIDAAWRGSFSPPPTEGPRPERDLNIWFIPLSSQFQDFNEPGQINDAARALGWKLTTFDGRFSPDVIVTGLRQAIADRADGIVLGLVDCNTVKSALQDVDRAGIPVVAEESFDCSDDNPSEPALFDAVVGYHNPDDPDLPMTFPDFIQRSWGQTQAMGVIAGTEGKAKLIDVKQTDAKATVIQDDGMRAGLRRFCPECEIVETVEFVGADLGAPLQQKVAQAIARNPDANAIVSPYDGATNYIAPAVEASGRKDSIWVVAGEGQAQTVSRMKRNKGVNAGAGLSVPWEFWSALDAINRLRAGERVPEGTTSFATGNGTQLFDNEHSPPRVRFEPPLDFRSMYLRTWGVD